MTCFEILGISEESNIKGIKRAYAKLVKIYTPENNATKYQMIRKAYDDALAYYKNKEKIKVLKSFKSWEEEEELIYKDKECDKLEAELIEFANELHNIYYNFELRINEESWEKLLKKDIVWNIKLKNRIENILIYFLIEKTYIPKNILSVIDKNFNWSTDNQRLYNEYDEEDIDFLLGIINEENTISYKYIEKIVNSKVDEYLSLKERIKELDYDTTSIEYKEYVLNAYNICDFDPEILYCMGMYYFGNDEFEESLIYLNKAINIDNKYIAAINKAGYSLYFLGRKEKAIKYLEYAISYEPENIETMAGLAQSYYSISDFEKAKKWLTKLNSIEFKTGKFMMMNVNNKLKGRRVKNAKPIIMTKKQRLRLEKKEEKLDRFDKLIRLIIGIPIIIMIIPVLLWGVIISVVRKVTKKELIKIENYNQLENLEQSKKVTLSLKDIHCINYYKISKKYKDRKNRILQEKEIDDKKLWKYVKGRVAYGYIDEKIVFFSNSRLCLNFKKSQEKFEVVGEIHSLDTEFYKKMLEDNNISEEDCFKFAFIDCNKS